MSARKPGRKGSRGGIAVVLCCFGCGREPRPPMKHLLPCLLHLTCTCTLAHVRRRDALPAAGQPPCKHPPFGLCLHPPGGDARQATLPQSQAHLPSHWLLSETHRRGCRSSNFHLQVVSPGLLVFVSRQVNQQLSTPSSPPHIHSTRQDGPFQPPRRLQRHQPGH